MRIVGKCPPEPQELEEAVERGFEAVELYLETQHLDRYEETVAALDEASVEVASVHTPHVTTDEMAYIKRAMFLAERYDALFVFHSARIGLRDAVGKGSWLEYDDIAYEASPGVSRRAIENIVLGQGEGLVLDVAHLFIASDSFMDDLTYLADHASHVHLCDATVIEDGLGFGEGSIDVDAMVRTVLGSDYDGDLVVEVMPEHQEEARDRVEAIMEEVG